MSFLKSILYSIILYALVLLSGFGNHAENSSKLENQNYTGEFNR